jgi:hypothetical protein
MKTERKAQNPIKEEESEWSDEAEKYMNNYKAQQRELAIQNHPSVTLSPSKMDQAAAASENESGWPFRHVSEASKLK